jgi:hypothetical protein
MGAPGATCKIRHWEHLKCQGTTLVVPQMVDLIPALAAAELQMTEDKTAGAKAQHDFVALSARLKSCPDTFCSLN